MTIEMSEKIKKYRLQIGLSQKDLAKATGLSQGFISGLEKGTRTPSLAKLNKLAEYFEIDAVELLPSEELEQEKAAIEDIAKTMSIVDHWLLSNNLKMNKDSHAELVLFLLEDHAGKEFDDKRIKKIEKQISRIIKIVKSENNEK